MIRRWVFIILWYGEAPTLSIEAAIAACWSHEPQSVITHFVGLGLPRRAERY